MSISCSRNNSSCNSSIIISSNVSIVIVTLVVLLSLSLSCGKLWIFLFLAQTADCFSIHKSKHHISWECVWSFSSSLWSWVSSGLTWTGLDWTRRLCVYLQVRTWRPNQHTEAPLMPRADGTAGSRPRPECLRGRVNQRGMLSKASEFICLIFRVCLWSRWRWITRRAGERARPGENWGRGNLLLQIRLEK